MSIPKYQQIKIDLETQIKSGIFKNGDKFYTEAELAKMYHVSSITIIRALNELVKDGYVVRYQGKGTFVSRSRKGKHVEFSDIEKFSADEDTVTVLSITKGNDPFYLKMLHLSAKEHYFCIERVRTANNTPYIYQKTYVNSKFIRKDIENMNEYYTSIYTRFKDDFNIDMESQRFKETNEIMLNLPEHVQTILELKDMEPAVLQIRRTKSSVFSKQILEYVESYKRWDFYKFEISSLSHK
ncbi:UTRA domain-containing protein [Granulicatella sp. zg-ZJ]|uniref:GntR family transcriptional regulator n=1 Tax=unclassified Granulicatella TaxID=2630493 RepID=UPI0013C243A2|nr:MULTISPECIES: GntR family transcriptional regulator [unclassified Granulicatella]MBS4749869.1 GntR family transcriptional regulator [Carnobacteriaceae bacterium zg-ZUI78]NEW62026.1 UTRA domain-containing protein [Granulicatella sp. zg-ZJ]NEW66749.1 UTRA domain-containing protein [Granulicatella sp. zg-84]QMI85965.1 GntR family transcriptional regulator [Carnobacteriaceae bacterium zg-84]